MHIGKATQGEESSRRVRKV